MNLPLVCNHDLPLPPRTTLADALHAYREYRRPGSARGLTEHIPVDTGRVGAAWYENFIQRERQARELRQLIKDQAADAARDVRISINVDAFTRALQDSLPAMEARMRASQTVGRRLKELALTPHVTPRAAKDMTDLANAMFLCRAEGHVGVTVEEGAQRFAFAFKCGSTKFCANCSREHSSYEAEHYGAACMEHVTKGYEKRAHYLTFTRPSVPLGKMKEGVAETFEMFRNWLEYQRGCSDVQRRKHGWSDRKKKIPLWQPGQRQEGKPYTGPGIHGVLVQLECHLTAAGMWHPHLNVIVLTRGDFSYAMARKIWGYNVECQPIHRSELGFAGAFRELIKYAARHVGEKSQAKADAGQTQAPPMSEWPDAALAEWFAATREEVTCEDGSTRIQGARWLRSYGSLHGIPPPEATVDEVRWLTPLTFTDDGVFFVGSIPGSKFPSSHAEGPVPHYRVPPIRPPPPT